MAGAASQGSGSVILSRSKMGFVPPKHDVISMPTQQYTNTEHIPMESYHPVVSIMLSYMNLKKAFGENLWCREVKIDNFFVVDLPYFSATAFRNDSDSKRSVRMKHISLLRKHKSHLWIGHTDF